MVSSVFVISSVPAVCWGSSRPRLSANAEPPWPPCAHPSGLRGLSSFISEEFRFLYCEFHICLCVFHSQENAEKSLIKRKSPKCFNLVASPSCKSRGRRLPLEPTMCPEPPWNLATVLGERETQCLPRTAGLAGGGCARQSRSDAPSSLSRGQEASLLLMTEMGTWGALRPERSRGS